MTGWLTRLRDRPIAEEERRAAMTAVVVLLAASALLLVLTRPDGQAPRNSERAAPSLRARGGRLCATVPGRWGASHARGRAGSAPVPLRLPGLPLRAHPGEPDQGCHRQAPSFTAGPSAARPTGRAGARGAAALAAQHAGVGGASRGVLRDRRGQRRRPGRLPDRAAARAPCPAGCSSRKWAARDVPLAKQGAVDMAAGRDRGDRGRFSGDFGVAVAVLGASFTGCEPSSEPALASTGPTPSAYALQSIPPARLRLYEQAGTRFDIDWSFLASIGAQECGNGECAGTNSAGCAGPMQIAYVRGSACSPGPGPTLWERYAVDADPGRALSINDPADAIYTAARILREDMGAPPAGGSYSEYRQAACRYYGACADASVSYAEEVMARAVQYGFTGTGSPAASSPSLARARQRRMQRERARARQRLADRQGRRKPDRPGRTPRGLRLHDLRPLRGVVLAVRRMGVAARRRPAARHDHALRLLRVALHLDPRTRRPGPPAHSEALARRRRLLRAGPKRAPMSGSCSASSRTGGSRRSRATTRAASPSSARSSPPRRPTPVSVPRSTGTRSRPPPTHPRRELPHGTPGDTDTTRKHHPHPREEGSRDATVTKDDGLPPGAPPEAWTAGEDPGPVRGGGRLG